MTQSSFKVAITGGIGSGKSRVAEIIKRKGYPVFSCDEIYGELLKDKSFLNNLVKNFGDILDENEELDRKKLASIVFSDSRKLNLLNELTHSEIIGEALRRSENFILSFCEVPLLFENGYEKLFDGIIVVLRNEEDRISSVVERDKISREEVIKRINRQYNYSNFDFTEYYVIYNNSDLCELEQKTLKILKSIVNKIS